MNNSRKIGTAGNGSGTGMPGHLFYFSDARPIPPGASRVASARRPLLSGRSAEQAERVAVFGVQPLDQWTDVPKKQDETKIAELEQLNAQLSSSLKRCRQILAECHSRLASNNNAPDKPDEGQAENSG